MRHAIDSREKKLDAYFARAKKYAQGDEVTSDLARLGAVLACGYIERCVEIVVLDRLAGKAHERIVKFVKAHFKRGTNYDCEAICQLLERFDSDWADQFRQMLQRNDKIVSSLSSLYALRNSIAHGGDQNRGLASIAEMYEDCKIIVDFLMDATKG